MNRRAILASLGSLSVGGCLRLADGASTTQDGTRSEEPDVDTGTTTGRPDPAVEVSTVDPPAKLGIGTTEQVTVRVENRTEGVFDGEILLLFDREVQTAESVTVAGESTVQQTITFELEALTERTVEVEVRAAGFRKVVFRRTVAPATYAVRLEWGAAEQNSAESWTSIKSFRCYEIRVETEWETLAVYDVGNPETEPRFLTDTGFATEDTHGTFRWFGGGDTGTSIAFEGVDVADAARLVLVGTPASELDELPVEGYVGEIQTDATTWTNELQAHTLSLSLED
ncbi:hypothetical protein G9C85_04640 [Halorubellus sp. JP-L1]|uniref:hypothetical protein n=1 Tax=Halorubellus sp. JP-L1 TaxID=2715753 RepID=UPI001407D061|nr:hypothetical protein [Halorubellus sp. JP-L1]NHN40923.1 hypothetical protein [Halorubellus sp. JP-L1]